MGKKGSNPPPPAGVQRPPPPPNPPPLRSPTGRGRLTPEESPIKDGEITTERGKYRVIEAPSLEEAWTAVRHMEEQGVDELHVGGKRVIVRIPSTEIPVDCRFCGEEPEIGNGCWATDNNERSVNVIHVSCEKCGRGVQALTEEEAIEFWNLVNDNP